MQNLLSIANCANLSKIEENIVVYLAGYLVKRSLSKFPCRDFQHLLISDEFNDQDDGLLRPSQLLIDFVTEMGKVFRLSAPGIVHREKNQRKVVFKSE